MAMITIFILWFSSLSAPPSGGLVIKASEGINPYNDLYRAVCFIESSNNPYAVGDKHLKNWSYGEVQIRQSRLDDYFQRTGERFTTADMFNPAKSRKVFMFYAMQYKSDEEICRTWNGGEKGMSKKSTLTYWNKIKTQLR